MTEYTAKKVYIKDAAGNYAIPYVNPADTNNLGVVKPDGSTITTAADGTISTNNSNLRALNAYSNNGELLTDAQGLAFVKNYTHSTFDRSKFTVVGSPFVSQDGILMDTYTKTKYIGLGRSIPIDKDFVFEFEVIVKNLNWQYFIGGTYNSSNDIVPVFVEITNDTTLRTTFILNNNGSNLGKYITKSLSNLGIVEGDRIKVCLSRNKSEGKYRAKYYLNGVAINNDTNNYITSDLDIRQTSNIIFGPEKTNNTGHACKGSYDLKTVRLVEDGVEVFSGNKTGIDTIKPDDYTTTATPPTISIDGVAQFDGTHYIYKSGINLSTATTFEIETPYITVPSDNNERWIYRYGNTDSNILALEFFYKKLRLDINNSFLTCSAVFTSGQLIKIKVSFDGAKYQVFYKLQNGDWVLDGTKETTDKPTSATALYFSNYGSAYSYVGTFDLNAFKIYVDGDLVYQPCLKIPYTESKTGSKIVDSIYRERVNDMAEQFGYANYYTLDEDNSNFTLPQVELYGLIGQRTLRDSYRNGINYWELYSNRDLEQGGSCTSGVEITFPKPFADTNYVLSVPYSAKSTTAFTPTQTGDWIAKGKGIL